MKLHAEHDQASHGSEKTPRSGRSQKITPDEPPGTELEFLPSDDEGMFMEPTKFRVLGRDGDGLRVMELMSDGSKRRELTITRFDSPRLRRIASL